MGSLCAGWVLHGRVGAVPVVGGGLPRTHVTEGHKTCSISLYANAPHHGVTHRTEHNCTSTTDWNTGPRIYSGGDHQTHPLRKSTGRLRSKSALGTFEV